MEKIQAAIAKARAARDDEARQRPGPKAQPVSDVPSARPAEGPVQDPVQGPAEDPVERSAPARSTRPPVEDLAADTDPGPAAAWAALKEFSPNTRHLARHRITITGGGPGTREVDMIRTRLIQQCRLNGWRRIAITSPGPRCGKSTLAANLGFSLGRQQDQRTLVAELDLRRPSLARLLGIEDRLNFARVLDGQGTFDNHARRLGVNLAFATNRDPVRHPAELLQSGQAARALTEIEATYAPTVFLFDMPPLLVNDDATAFLEQVDCALLVAAAETTTIREIDTCERMIAAQTNVMGVVLNKCRYMPEEEKYGY